MTRKLLLALLILGAPVAPAFAQSTRYCWQNLDAGATGGGALRVNGFTLEIKPDHKENLCRATVRSPKRVIVFELNDWGIDILPVTGKDVNGDKQPDAVFLGFSGGAHCCYTYWIVSLGQRPGLIRSFENQYPASFEDLDHDGEIEIVTRDGSFDSFEAPHAFSPTALLVLKLEGRKLKDVSPKYWSVYEQQIIEAQSKLSEEQRERFRLGQMGLYSDDYTETQAWILTIVLSYLYGGRGEDAWKTLDESWPAKDKDRIKEKILYAYATGLRSTLDSATRSGARQNGSRRSSLR